MELTYTYIDNKEAEKFQFFRQPMLLFTDPQFQKMSCEAKVLYGLMLDRTGLSRQNVDRFVDHEGRAFIYFSKKEVMALLNCAQQKAGSLFRELEQYGLIERTDCTTGKRPKIYVKCFCMSMEPEEDKAELPQQKEASNNKKDASRTESDAQCASWGDDNHPAGDMKTIPPGDENHPPIIESDLPHSDLPDSYESIYLSDGCGSNRKKIDAIDFLAQKSRIHEQIAYDYLLDNKNDPGIVDELVELMQWVSCTTKPYLYVNGDPLPTELVRIRLQKLDESHIEYVLECLNHSAAVIKNRRSYLMTCLYNAPSGIDGYLSNRVQQILYSA